MLRKKRMLIGFIFFAIIIIALCIFNIARQVTTTFVVTFDTKGCNKVEQQFIKKGMIASQPQDPTKEGHFFISWLYDGKIYDFNTPVDANISLTANWQEDDPNKELVSVKFNSKGGTTIANSVIEKGTKIESPIDPLKKGYTFTGWTLNDKDYNFDSGVNNDLELIATWEKDEENKTSDNNSSKTPSSNKNTNKDKKDETTSTNQETTPSTDKENNSTPTSETVKNPNYNRNTIHFISVGPGDAILIESNGKYGLIDSTNPYNDGTPQSFQTGQEKESVVHVVDYLNNLGIKYLDFIIATHSHSDHIGGMPEIAKHFVTNETKYYYRTYDGASDNAPDWDNEGYYNRAIAAMSSKGAQLIEVTNKKPTFKYGNFELSLINTDKSAEIPENENSIGTIVKCGNIRIFLSSDIEARDANKIASTVGKVDLMKLNHHGCSGNTYEYMKTLQPKTIIVTGSNVPIAAYGPIAYTKEKYNTKSYHTVNVPESIKVHVTPNNYTLESSGPEIDLNNIVTDKNGKWSNWEGRYVYIKDGKLYKSWLNWNNKWYYLTDEGLMVTGWQQLKWSQGTNWFYFTSDGDMVTGWQYLQWSGGTNWFYFDPTNGYLIENKCLTIDGKNYCFNENGVCYNQDC